MHLVHVIGSECRPTTEDPMTRRLTYMQIADDISTRIAAGEYPPGSQLPSYGQLATLYSVSISTAQRAILVLRTRGDAVGEPGRGVFVAELDDQS